MKKLLVLFLAVLLLLAALPAHAIAPYEKMQVANCEQWVSLRKSPSRSAARLCQVPLGAMVTYLDQTDDFLKVSYNGLDGYIDRDYLLEYSMARYIPMYVVRCKEWVSQRESESTASRRMAKIPLGAEVWTVYRTSDDVQLDFVEYRGKRGYVLSQYLSFMPEVKAGVIKSATLHIPDKSGNDFTQTLTDEDALYELATLIDHTRAGIYGNCPHGALLEVTMANGDLLRFMLPTDGCFDLIGENLISYTLPEDEGESFWQLFDQAQEYLY